MVCVCLVGPSEAKWAPVGASAKTNKTHRPEVRPEMARISNDPCVYQLQCAILGCSSSGVASDTGREQRRSHALAKQVTQQMPRTCVEDIIKEVVLGEGENVLQKVQCCSGRARRRLQNTVSAEGGVKTGSARSRKAPLSSRSEWVPVQAVPRPAREEVTG